MYCPLPKSLNPARPCCCRQAHAFQAGLKLSPDDKVLRQGFWDAIALVSQSRQPEL